MTDCCAAPGLMPLHEGLKQLIEQTSPVTEVDVVALSDCLNRVLAESVYSPVNVPSHNNSAMDGYALRLSDLDASDCLPLAGTSLAGHPFKGVLPEGQCVRIMTGASIPEGADIVVMQEQTKQVDNGIVFVSSFRELGQNIRLAGEDVKKGTQVFTAGRQIKPQDIGLLASLGVAEIRVFRKIKVAVFSTGDELKLPGEALAAGDIYDSNRYAVKAMLERIGADVIDFGKIADDKNLLRETFLKADREADAVITSGGVSVGDADFVKDILNELGETFFWKLAIKPGKPFAFGRLPGSYFFGLPGNPVSATVTFQQLALPALKHMMGAEPEVKIELKAICRTPLKKLPGRMDFQRGTLATSDSGQLEVVTTGSQGSGVFRSMSVANCYIVLPLGGGDVNGGDLVTVQLFRSPLD